MKIAVTGMLLAVSLMGVAVPANASAGGVGVQEPAQSGWLTGGFAPDPPPPPLPDWCTPDNADPTWRSTCR